MKITLKLFSAFRDCIKDSASGSCEVIVPENTAISDVLAQFRVPEDIPKILLINGAQKTASAILQDGDTLSVFPPIAGG